MITPEREEIGKLLITNSFSFPTFQRDYEWDEESCNELLQDIKETEGNLYLGPMIFWQESAEGQPDSGLKVVDGQQRLTSVFLLLIACRQRALVLGENKIASAIMQRLAFLDPITGEEKGLRIRVAGNIASLFEYMAAADWAEIFPPKLPNGAHIKRQVRILRPIYECLKAFVNTFKKPDLTVFLSKIYGAYVVKLNISEYEEAFGIFERTNARGVKLDVEDLLKNFFYQKGVDDFGSKWDFILEQANGSPGRLLKYFYVSQKGPVSKAKLFKRLKVLADENSGHSATVDSIKAFSSFYALSRANNLNDDVVMTYFKDLSWSGMANNPNIYCSVAMSIRALNLFKVTQPIPLLYAGLQCILRTKEPHLVEGAHLFKAFTSLLERFHFVNTVVGGNKSNEIEDLYQRYSGFFAKSKDFSETYSKLRGEMLEKVIEVGTFASKFVEINYEDTSHDLIRYIFDRFTNHGIDPCNWKKIFYKGGGKAAFELEHFYPQVPKRTGGDEDTYESRHNIGNLLCVGKALNLKLDNLSPGEKLAVLKTDSNAVGDVAVSKFISSYGERAKSWNHEDILGRAQDMALDAFQTVWKP